MAGGYPVEDVGLTDGAGIRVFQGPHGVDARYHAGHRTRGIVELFDMVSPDGLFKWIPLGQGRAMDGSNPLGSKSTGSGHSVKAEPGV
jgi:hypothetical protein